MKAFAAIITILAIFVLIGFFAEPEKPAKVESRKMVVTAVSGMKEVFIDVKDPLTGETARHIRVGRYCSSDYPIGKTVDVRVETYIHTYKNFSLIK